MVELVRDFCQSKYTSFVITVNSCDSCTYSVWFTLLFISPTGPRYLFANILLVIGAYQTPGPCVTLYPSLLQVTLYSYNWSVDLGTSLNRELVRLVQWQNARAHVVHCLLNQKMGLFHHYCFSDAPIHEMDSKQVKTLPCLNQFRRHCWFLKVDL